LKDFCEFANITPEEFQRLDRKDARNIAWKYIKTLIDKPSVATMAMAALKSFYRNHDGETLPFDSSRGGKHYFNNLRRKKASYEKVPTKEEVYQIADMATSLRDRAIILTLFQSGMRVNALCNLKYGHVKYQLEQSKVPLRLRITDEIDTKLRGYRIDFYDTFISKEAIDALKKYCELYHRNSTDDTPLFLSKRGRPIGQVTIWSNFKKCIRRAGFDKKTMWVHSLRKAFKKQVRKSEVSHDFAEAIMGHVLKGAQENYFSRNDTEDIEREYSKTDFSREGNLQPIQQEMETMKSDRKVLESVIRQQQSQIDALKIELSDKYLDAKTFLDEMDALKEEIEEMKKQR
jgi:integrase